MQSNKKILLFGSGLMAQTVVTYLLKRPQNTIHIVSNIMVDAKRIAENTDSQRCTFGQIDVKDEIAVNELVKDSDIVISYVPAFLHIYIAKACLKQNKNMVTASYISPEMKALDEQVKSKNLIFLNELGLDPGIDHLATMKIIHQAQKEGWKIKEYESWCGGLPSAQFCDNPLGYKFTWSPIGAFMALKNKAVFINNSKQETVQSEDVQYYGANIELNQALTLEGYPNRDSLAYKKTYGLNDATKVLRGTLRYHGFCTIVNAWKELGLLDQKKTKQSKWIEILQQALKATEGQNIDQKKQVNSNTQQVPPNILAYQITKHKQQNILIKIADKNKNLIENLVSLLEKKLALKEGQTDLVAMQHIFIVQKQGKQKKIKSTLIRTGDRHGSSAMSVLVGTPTAIGAQLILDGSIEERGVLMPIFPDIYQPVLSLLAAHGIKLRQSQEQL